MFRRNKGENKTKLEHKLYLARETPEPIFDLTDCELRQVPQGIYSLCRVFLKEILRLEHNCLTTLSGGGQLRDLHVLKILDLHDNAFIYLPDEIDLLTNLRELYLNENQLKKLPATICNLVNLRILNLADNSLKCLPDEIGNLHNLNFLAINNNKSLNKLPKSIGNAQNLQVLELDANQFVYPPENVIIGGVEAILRYICNDVGVPFLGPNVQSLQDSPCDKSYDQSDGFEAKIWKLENIKKQKLQEFLEMEKANELSQRQEFELANAQKVNREKLLADITLQQSVLDAELIKLQQEKETERFKLIEQLVEAENHADLAINLLLKLSSEPLAQLLEQEKLDEERLLAVANKYNQDLRKSDVLVDMQGILQQEMERFQKFHENRLEVSKSILEQEMQSDYHLTKILEDQDAHKAELINQLQEDSDLQRVAVGALLERGDSRSWGLVQQVRLVESQLAALTHIEMDRKKLEIDQHLNDLAEKRINLSILLLELLEQQKERRAQLLSTLQTLEQISDSGEDFWLRQYQRLLERLPEGLSEAQRIMDPALSQILLINGVINCLPFLAKLTKGDVEKITESDLRDAGITNFTDRIHILDAFQMYKKEQNRATPSAPPAPMVEEASAPPAPTTASFLNTECVVCMDMNCEVIYVPCGHLCCCINCSTTLLECPMCRAPIERKIRVIQS